MGRTTESKPTQEDVVRVRVPAQPRKRPRQTRSVALVEALKQTGRDILEKEGRAALSAARLAESSGVAVSSIYEYFPTMESLVAAIFHDDRMEARRRVCEEILALPPSARLFDGILLVMRTGLAMLHRWSRIDPELNVSTSRYDELVRLDLIKSESPWSAVVMPRLVERFSDEILVRDREKVLFIIDQALQALPRAIRIENPAWLAHDDTAILLARMLHALLTTPSE